MIETTAVGWRRSIARASAFIFLVAGLSRLAIAQNPVAFDLAAPKLVGEASDWLNTGGKALAFEKGKVYVVEFWTFG